MQKCSCEKRHRRTSGNLQPLAERRTDHAGVERLRAIQAGEDHARGAEPRADGDVAKMGSLRSDRRGSGDAGGGGVSEGGAVAAGSTRGPGQGRAGCALWGGGEGDKSGDFEVRPVFGEILQMTKFSSSLFIYIN